MKGDVFAQVKAAISEFVEVDPGDSPTRLPVARNPVPRQEPGFDLVTKGIVSTRSVLYDLELDVPQFDC